MKYKYEIIRSPRKSMSVSVSGDNKIIVRCSWETPLSKIEDFLASKERWIDKIVTRNAERLAVNDDVVERKCVYLDGRKLPLVISDKNLITSEAVYVKKFENIQKLFTDACTADFMKNVEEISWLTMITPNSVNIRKYTGRWGCCDGRNNLYFNYMVFMLPPYIRRYIIVHELCHVICHNHSPAFWKLVSDYVPDYKAVKKQLAAFDFLTTLY